MELHICKICGSEFETRYKQSEYCSEYCRKEAARRREASRVRIGRWHKRKADYFSIDDIVKQATALGLSYGKYVSMRSIGKI